MTALPPLTALENRPRFIEAYSICLQTERDASPQDIVPARILGYMLLHGPSSAAQDCVAKDIIQCGDQEARLELGKAYFNQFIRPFKKFKGRTPIPTPRTLSFDMLKEEVKIKMETHPQNHEQAKKSALLRDGFRCMVTRHYDKVTVRKGGEFRQQAIADPDYRIRSTHCCHIMSESTNAGILSSSTKQEYAASSWTLLQRFGYSDILKELNGKNIHRLENVMTLSSDLHDGFDRLEFWFEATSEVNCYNIIFRGDIDPLELDDPPTTVTFTSTDPNLPLPSPVYLSLHAACAKIAYLSGESGSN